MIYNFNIGTSKQASDFEVTLEFIINYIKPTFQRGNDIAESLRTLSLHDTEKWKPSLEASKAEDKEIKKLENRQFEIEFKASLDESMKWVPHKPILLNELGFIHHLLNFI